MLARCLPPARVHSHSQPNAPLSLPLDSLQPASPQLAQPGGRACWQFSVFYVFFLYFFSSNPILGAALWADVCTITQPDAQRTGTLYPYAPPQNLYILWHHLLTTAQLYITQKHCWSGTSCCRRGYKPQSEAQCVLCAVLPSVPRSYSSSSRIPFSTMVSPHRNPPEHPGESPCIHRLSIAEQHLTMTLTGTDTYPHTHTPPKPYVSSVHLLVLKRYNANHFTYCH